MHRNAVADSQHEDDGPDRIQQLQAAQRHGLLRLRWPAPLEQRFRAARHVSTLLIQRTAFFCAFALVLGFALLDGSVGQGLFTPPVQAALFYGVCPALLLALLATLPPVLQPWLRPLTALVLWSSGLVFIGILASYGGPAALGPYAYECLILHACFCYFFAGLMFYEAVLVSLSLLVTFLATQYLVGLPTERLAYVGFFVGGINGLGMLGGYLLEYLQRRNYLFASLADEMARRDPLTSVLNRRAFSEELASCMRSAAAQGRSLTLIIVDVDRFKRANDTHGHLHGDRILVNVARALQDMAAGPEDRVGRFGGDEFLVLLTGGQTANPEAVVDGLREHASRRLRENGLAARVPVTVSAGGVYGCPEPQWLPDDLIQLADRALYEAKADGRNCSCCRSMTQPRKSEVLRFARRQ